MRAVLSTVEPFDIRYGPLQKFDPYPGVAYRIEPATRRFRRVLKLPLGTPWPCAPPSRRNSSRVTSPADDDEGRYLSMRGAWNFVRRLHSIIV